MGTKHNTKRDVRASNTVAVKKQAGTRKGTTRPAVIASEIIDDFKAPEVGPGTLGATREDVERNYAHVRECAERIVEKLEAEDTPDLVRRVIEAYLSDLGAEYFKHPQVVRAAYEVVCLIVSRPPSPLRPLVKGGKQLVGRVEALLSRDPNQSLAEARRLERNGFLKHR